MASSSLRPLPLLLCGNLARTARSRRSQFALSFAQMRTVQYGAVVAGAGPAGLAVVGNLLDTRLQGSLLWVDPRFAAGRLQGWSEVPSNTKVQLFIDYAKALDSFRRVLRAFEPARDAVGALAQFDPSKGCALSHAAEMVDGLTQGFLDLGEAEPRVGKVTGANWNSRSSSWTVELGSESDPQAHTVAAARLVLCIGSAPRGIPVAVPGLDIAKVTLDVALKPTRLSTSLPVDAVVGVIGTSHSAILVLLNLYNLASTSHPGLRIKWFTRTHLLYAEYKKDYILYDNTGLKGQAADFARENLEDAKLAHSPVGKFVERVDCSQHEQAQYERHLPACSHVVQAVGFVTNPVPDLFRDGAPIEGVQHDPLSGNFYDIDGKQIQGLHGAGIAFPERVTDPEGNVESSVGLWKFMRFLKRVTPEWTRDSFVDTSDFQQSARL